MTSESRKVYKVAIIGAGPAGVGVIVRAARIGVLDELLDSGGVALIHGGSERSLGRGNLGNYIINSNTFARSLMASVLEDKPDLDPPEKATGTFLEKLKTYPSTIALNNQGYKTATLEELGDFLADVGGRVKEKLERHDMSRCLLETTAVSIHQEEGGIVKVICFQKPNETFEIYAKHVVLATGGSQTVPTMSNPAQQSKLFMSDSVLQKNGSQALREYLRNKQAPKVCIVGGSHSAFSVGWVLLNKIANPKSKRTEDEIRFEPRSITQIHRSPIRCYYQTQKEAEADGFGFCPTDRSGAVNTFTGLREDAKRLYKDIRSGKENRIRFCQVKAGGSTKVQEKAFDEADVIIWSCGYGTNAVPIYNATGIELPVVNGSGQVKVDVKGRLVRSVVSKKDKQPREIVVDRILGVGIGFGLPSPTREMKSETRSDGVAVYQRRGASLMLAEILGTHVYGQNCDSYEAMFEKQEKARKLAQQEPPKSTTEQGETMSRLAAIGTAVVVETAAPPPVKVSKAVNLEELRKQRRTSIDSHILRMQKGNQEASTTSMHPKPTQRGRSCSPPSGDKKNKSKRPQILRETVEASRTTTRPRAAVVKIAAPKLFEEVAKPRQPKPLRRQTPTRCQTVQILRSPPSLLISSK